MSNTETMYLPKLYHMCLALVGFFMITVPNPTEIRYFHATTIPFDMETLQADTIAFRDTLSGEVLHQVKSKQGIPLFYAQEVVTNVCFDDKCRPLIATVYWNITGRYLGFRLTGDEFFSRKDHEPFTSEDYVRLHGLLADSRLPFANVSFEELIQPEVNPDSVDGITGATSTHLSSFVVEGAAYTTYTLWNIIYGPSQAWVRKVTEKEMNPKVLALILKSPSSEDRIWGMRKIDTSKAFPPQIEKALLDIMRSEDFFVAYKAINLLNRVHLRSESLQIRLFSLYQKVNHNLKKLMVQKLKAAPTISEEVIRKSRDMLTDVNGQQLGYFLDLYTWHSIHDLETCRAVARLLDVENAFISKKAYQYLMKVKPEDEGIMQAIKIYEHKHGK